MIKAQDAIDIGRSLLGTPYKTYDCINLQKKIIRTAPGGKPGYTTAGTNSLWRSNDLTNKREGIKDAKPGEFVFKWRSGDTDKYHDGKGDFHHIGLVTERKTVIHSSSVEKYDGKIVPGGVGAIETPLDSKWSHTATHKLIQPLQSAESIEQRMDYHMIEKMKVITDKDPLNVRDEPSKDGRIISKIPKDTIVESMAKAGSWEYVRYNDIQGYVSAQYLMEWYDDSNQDSLIPVDEYTNVVVDAKGNIYCIFAPFTIYEKSQYTLND